MPQGYILFRVNHLQTIDTFEPEYDFFELLQVVYSKEKAEKFFKDYVENFEETVGGMTKLKDGKSERIYIGEPIPKRTTQQENGFTYEIQTFENYPEEKMAYLKFDYPLQKGVDT
jgi:hypothetical protein